MICNCALKYSKMLQINMVTSPLFGICQFLHHLDLADIESLIYFTFLKVEPSSFLIPEQMKAVKNPKEKH